MSFAKILGTALAVSGLLTAGAAEAAKIDDKRKCMSSVEIVQEMLEQSDSGEKEKDLVSTLVDLSKGLCDRERYAEAEDALSVARGIMGTEEGAGTDKDEEKN